MTGFRRIGSAKTTVCTSCGGVNRTHNTVCSYCRRAAEIAAMPKRTCAYCGLAIPHSRTSLSPYCSLECACEVKKIFSKAIGAVHAAIRAGALPKLCGDIQCVDCGEPARHYEHRDYTKPLDVVPVCISCNYSRGPADVIRHAFASAAQQVAA